MTTTGAERDWPHQPIRSKRAWADAPAAPLVVTAPPPAVVQTGPRYNPPPLPRPAVLIVAGTIALAVLLICGSIGDWVWRTDEMSTLLDRIETSEASMLVPNRELGITLFSCRDPDSTDCNPAKAAHIAGLALPTFELTGRRVAEVKVSRFHGAIAAARDRYVDHSEAWQAFLGAVADDPEAAAGVPNHIFSTFHIAGAAARAAVPPLARHDERARVDRIFR